MNRGLMGGLAATLALSAWAALNPTVPSTPRGDESKASASRRDEAIAANPVPVPMAATTEALPAASDKPFSTASGHDTLPEHWPSPEVAPATRNPFVAPSPPAPEPVAALVAAPAEPPPPALPPAPNYRFWGRMNIAGGRRLTYVARDIGAPVAIDAEMRLEDGWAVESIGENLIVLSHAATQQQSVLTIPPHGPAIQAIQAIQE